MWDKKPEERLRAWRQFRLDLQDLDQLQCIDKVAKFWAMAPQSNQFLASDLPETWPSAWQLLNDNLYDDAGVALGIYYTLVLLENFKNEDVKFNVLKTTEGLVHTVKVQDQILNYNIGEVVNTNELPQEISIVYQYDHTELKIQ